MPLLRYILTIAATLALKVTFFASLTARAAHGTEDLIAYVGNEGNIGSSAGTVRMHDLSRRPCQRNVSSNRSDPATASI
jgi:hypothetical protein